ncbi:cytochrome P450 [Gymnopilus junonius]|uniref:Cytochrome P450 n=1 Tax=Gymnopilus junonius TaxID=109634 RepID=A0A9P5TH05_GYMJU|nr:cytochrome P450 [Gymnopilus junonius]
MDFRVKLCVDILAALITHLWFHKRDPVSLRASLGALVIAPLVSTYILHGTLTPSFFSDLIWVYPVFYLTLCASICTYRLSPFHPLAKYPGPVILKVTKLWAAWIAYTGKTHIYFKDLHDKYGPTIRVGPNELSTIEKDFIPQILGHQGMPKGPMWDGRRFLKEADSRGYDNLVDIRDPVIHAQLRKPWNKAFSVEAVKGYEELVTRKALELKSLLEEVCNTSEGGIGQVDLARWVSFFSYDLMGEMAFSADFHLMRDRDKEDRFNTMVHAVFNVSITQHIPWIAKAVRDFPGLNKWMHKFTEDGVQQAIKRANTEVKRKDLFHYMGEATGGSEPDLPLIINNILLSVFAGSDTTASVLASAFYLLMSHPEQYRKLQQEVDTAFKEQGIDIDSPLSFDDDADIKTYGEVLGSLPYLNGVINEALRLFPVVPVSLQRAPGKGSKARVLQSDTATMKRNLHPPIRPPPRPAILPPSPDSFIPERWTTSNKEYTTSRDAFIPFSVGPRNCAGRPLAMLELRYVVSILVRAFDMEFDRPSYDPRRWEEDLQDRFTLDKGVLGVRLTRRGRKGGKN